MRRLIFKAILCLCAVPIFIAAVHAQPGTVAIQGQLVKSNGSPLTGTRAFRVRFFTDALTASQLGGDLTGSIVLSPAGRFTIAVTPPVEALVQDALFYELAVDSANTPDGAIDAIDVFPARVQVHSVLFAGTAKQLGGAPNSNIIANPELNTVQPSAAGATLSGGRSNSISSANTTVGGGFNNSASGANATASGGISNLASGSNATVPGGLANAATGDYSLAAGRRAKATHTGAFVWGDSTDSDFTSSANDQFLIRAGGGVGINKNNPAAGTLDVAGDIKFSGTITGKTVRSEVATGQRILSGVINGTTGAVLGIVVGIPPFTVVKNSTGNYTITYTISFAETPATVFLSSGSGTNLIPTDTGATQNQIQVQFRNTGGSVANPNFFHFITIGR